MNRVARLVMLLVLCLAVPVQGFAGLASFGAGCPMGSSSAWVGEVGHHADAVSAAVDGAHCGCCDEGDTTGGPGFDCKAGQGCHAGGSVAPLAATRMPVVVAAGRVRAPAVAVAIPGDAVPGIWRPPAQR